MCWPIQADITRVVTFQIARELSVRAYPEIGVPEAHHDISHHGDEPGTMAEGTQINAYHMRCSRTSSRSWRPRPTATARCSITRCCCTARRWATATCTAPHNLPIVARRRRLRTAQGRPSRQGDVDTPMMNLGLTLLDKVGVHARQDRRQHRDGSRTSNVAQTFRSGNR